MSAGYLAESTLVRGGGATRLELQTALGATPSGLVDHPTFFTGFLARPDVAAAGLLAVADVAASRYGDAGLMKRLANLDPVVTASGDRLRFESFSACNGVHARFDLLGDGLDSGEVAFGTTNVDVNQPLRSALSAVGRGELMHLSVGADELRVSTPADTHVERKVSLPDRWVRGFAETPSLAARMALVAELRGPAIGAFLRSLPNVTPPGPTYHALRTPRGIQETRIAVPGSVSISGSARLRAAQRVLRFATSLEILSGPAGSSGWCFALPGGRLTLLLSPSPYRGFSGEGSLLMLLARPDAMEAGRQLIEHLSWHPVIDADRLCTTAGLSPAEVDAGLAWLAASGRVGYDISEGRWFHRDLPVDGDKVLRRNPRLMSARRLADGDAITDVSHGRWRVRGSRGDRYDVRREGPSLRCTCTWEIEHLGTRGPCKHILAVVISEQDGATARNGAPSLAEIAAEG